MSVVLMYHAIHEDKDLSSIDPQDRPYAISRSVFTEQIDQLADLSTGVFNSGESLKPDIVVTFDDGHASNLTIAAPLLLERNIPAIFFITTDYLNARKGFLTSTEVQQLSGLPGMHIGSHGVTHDFFDDLDDAAALAELEQSRRHLESLTGVACNRLSFPGGRFTARSIELVRAAGYHQWYGSAVKTIETTAAFDEPVTACRFATESQASACRQRQHQPLGRVAIKRNMSHQDFGSAIKADNRYFRRMQMLDLARLSTRRILGNHLYHGLYQIFSRG